MENLRHESYHLREKEQHWVMIACLCLWLVKTKNKQMVVLPKFDKIRVHTLRYTAERPPKKMSYYLFAISINGLYLSFDTQL